MKKKNQFLSLSAHDLKSKYDAAVKELVEYKLSMDVSAVKSASNPQNLAKDLKNLRRAIAIANSKKV